MTVSVLVVDDHEVVRRGLADLCAAEDDLAVVGQAASGAEAIARAEALRPDVVVLDVRLPDENGVAVCRRLRSILDPAPACLMLTSYSDDEAFATATAAGAAGWLLKQVSGRRLVDAIRTVAEGASLPAPGTVATAGGRPPCDDDDRATRRASLTSREETVLTLLAEGLTNRQIGVRLGLTEKTVKNYVSSVLQKLGLERRVQAALYASERPVPGHPDGTPPH